MTRRVLYVAAPLAPTPDGIERTPQEHAAWSSGVVGSNLQRALRWLAWLRASFPETTFIAPWIATVQSLNGDDSPELREAGLVDDCAVVERCDGIVLCGGRISSGMRREMEHGMMRRKIWIDPGDQPERFEVYDLTSLDPAPKHPYREDYDDYPWSQSHPKFFTEILRLLG